MIERLIHKIKIRQAELQVSIAAGNPSSWDDYRYMVGVYQGLNDALQMIDSLLEAEEYDHQR